MLPPLTRKLRPHHVHRESVEKVTGISIEFLPAEMGAGLKCRFPSGVVTCEWRARRSRDVNVTARPWIKTSSQRVLRATIATEASAYFAFLEGSRGLVFKTPKSLDFFPAKA